MSCVATLLFLIGVAPEIAAGEAEDDSSTGVAAEVGYGVLGEDSFLNLRLKFGYARQVPTVGCEDDEGECKTRLRVTAQAPLRLRLVDRAPREDSLLRRRDWDEVADFFRVARRVQYGESGEVVHARFGELGPISLGHGTLVHDYYNVITVDHFQPGFYAETNTLYGGAELLADNVVSPSVLGARGYLRPLSFVDDDHLFAQLALGASLVSDIDAPTRLASANEQPEAVVDRTYRPAVDREQTTSLWGVDLEMPVVETERFDLMPYTDLNGHTSLGMGLHTGAFANYRTEEELEFSGRLEHRLVGRDYLPAYVSTLYAIDRFQYTGWGAQLPAPKVRVAASLDKEAAHGFAASLTARHEQMFRVTAGYADHQGPDNATAHLRASGNPIEEVELGAYYYKQNMGGISDFFDPQGSLAVGEMRAQIYGPVSIHGTYGRLWRVNEQGEYRTVDDWSVGVGASRQF
ncbi:MAG: hypothetical protein ACOCV2_03830 [Persicimonas sp.]